LALRCQCHPPPASVAAKRAAPVRDSMPTQPVAPISTAIRFACSLRARARIVDRAALLRTLGYHLAHDALRVHLDPNPRRGRMTGDGHDDIAARREVIERALGRLRLLPHLEIRHAVEWRDIEPLARNDQLLYRVLTGQMEQQALRRRLVRGEIPDSPIAVAAGNVPALGTLRRRKRP